MWEIIGKVVVAVIVVVLIGWGLLYLYAKGFSK
jgi:hypothetical protein